MCSGLIEADVARAKHRSTQHGWSVVAGAFTVMFVTFGAAYSFSAFFAPLQEAFASPRGAISQIFSIAVPLYFLVGAISGPLADRIGPRVTCLGGVLVGGTGLIFAAAADALWQVYVGFGLGLGLGIGFSYVPAIAAVQRWFVRRRGLASGLAVAGIGLGTLVVPLVAAQLIASLGWRVTWVILGITIIVVGGVAALFIDGSPEQHGLHPDGGVASIRPENVVEPVMGVSLQEAIASRPFILLYLSLVAISIGAFTPFVHLVPYAEDHGLERATAVTIFALVGIGSTFGRFLLGSVADRVGRRRSLAAVFIGLALMQLWWLTATTAWQLGLFALVFGTCYGGFVALYPALTVDYFGNRNASGIIGILYTAAAVGTALGPKLAGDAFDAFGSYTAPITVGATFALLAVVFVIVAPEPDINAVSQSDDFA